MTPDERYEISTKLCHAEQVVKLAKRFIAEIDTIKSSGMRDDAFRRVVANTYNKFTREVKDICSFVPNR